jgi:hypothetical protein
VRVAIVFACGVLAAGCGSRAETGAEAKAATTASSDEDRDAGAMEDLEASDQWREPSCRWLETGTWIAAYPQDTAVYRAAHALGYIEMEQVGTVNRIGTPEPAWRVALTETGKAEFADCPRQSKSSAFGVPVSRRELISGTYAGKDYDERTAYDVEFRWVPTDVGSRVRDVLTSHMTVEEGTYTTKVYMRNGPRVVKPGEHGWVVVQIIPVRVPPRE